MNRKFGRSMGAAALVMAGTASAEAIKVRRFMFWSL
jgi:hypothetical protein